MGRTRRVIEQVAARRAAAGQTSTAVPNVTRDANSVVLATRQGLGGGMWVAAATKSVNASNIH